MYVVWLSPGGFGGFTGIFRDAEICPGFPPPKAALATVASWEKGQYGVTVARLGLRNKGGKSALTGFKHMLGLSMYGGGH